MLPISFLLDCGVVAGALFVVVFLIEGYLRPSYNPMRQPVSALSQGPRGWVQKFNFYITGLLLMAYSWGLYLTLASTGALWGPILLFVHGAGVVGAGVFDTDYGTARIRGSLRHNRSGIVHDLFSTIVFLSLAAGCCVFANIFTALGQSAWALYSLITGVLYAAGFITFARSFAPQSRLAPIAGLLQRATIILGVLWVALVALHLQ